MGSIKMGPKQATAKHALDLSELPAKRDYRRVAAFSERFLRIPKGTGAGEPFKLRGFQRDEIVKRFYPPTGTRPRQGLVSMSRGNGKTGLAAVLALYGLLGDEIEGAQVLVVASDERQARLVFNAARRMVELSPELAEQVQIYADRLYVPATDSTMMPLPAEPAALQGWDPTLMIVDELHVVTAEVWEAISLASGKRPESLTLAISTPADSTDSIMWKLVEHGRACAASGDTSFVLIEYAADPGCAIDDREQWKKANPAMGMFLHEDALAATLATTREDAFRRYRLGQWVGSANSWLPWGEWEKHATGDGLPDERTPVVLAFDGSASGDSTALIGCVIDTGYLFTVTVWEAPEDDDRWRVPRREVAAMIDAAFDRWDVRELAADPWGWRTELEEWSARHGDRVLEWNTAHAGRMAPATDRLAQAVHSGTISHDGDPILTAHVGHAVAKRSVYGELVSKDKKNPRRKIDAAVAAIVAFDRAAWHRANPPKRRRVVRHTG